MRSLLLSLLFGLACVSPDLWAADSARLTAEVEPAQISVDDTVSLKLTVQVDGTARIGAPAFTAPGLETVNQYQGTFVESYYENGRFGMRNNRQMTYVLKAAKPGEYAITKIQIDVNGTPLTAPDLKIQVSDGGARGSGASGQPAPNAAPGGKSVAAFVRAELSKPTVYKGEQLVVSYYLYTRARIFNISVDKYPILTGFLREDLDLPILSQRLTPERVSLQGVPWERSLLLQYAAYPLKEGKLKIDPLNLKFNIYGNAGGVQDEDDPFSAFFQQMAPRPGSAKSEIETVEVLPLPEAGKPADYAGAVGQFTLSATLDKREVKANEPVTLSVQVQGRGNMSSVSELKAEWPSGLELYDSKKQEKAGAGGLSTKTFEYLLIPRQAGDLQIPALSLTAFDPNKKEYVTAKTESFALKVNPGAPGSESAPVVAPSLPRAQSAAGKPESLRPLKLSQADPLAIRGLPPWRWVYWLCVACFGVFLIYVAIEWMRRGRILSKKAARDEAKRKSRSWDGLTQAARAAQGKASWTEVMRTYEDLAGTLFDQLDQRLAEAGKPEFSSRSLPRKELSRILVEEHGWAAAKWEPIERALEMAETVRFTGASGVIAEKDAREQLLPLVENAKRAVAR